MKLQVENMSSTSEGVYVTHQRSKQRNDKLDTRFIVPRAGSYAGILEDYLHNIKSTLSKTTGRLLWTGRSDSFANLPLGKNSIADVPHFMAGYLKDDVKNQKILVSQLQTFGCDCCSRYWGNCNPIDRFLWMEESGNDYGIFEHK